MVIYKITNLINNKLYIGKDSKNNPEYLGSGTIIKKAILKYGKENFTKEILEYCENQEDLNQKEIYWIQKLDSLIPTGYNITEGGTGGDTFTYQNNDRKLEIKEKRWNTFMEKFGGVPNKGCKMSAEQIEKIKKSSTGRKYPNRKKILFTKEHKKNISKSNIGRKMSEESKEKMSKSKIGTTVNEKTKMKISNTLKGNKNALGYRHSPEEKIKMGLSRRGIPSWNKGLSYGLTTYILKTPTNELIKFKGQKMLKFYIDTINLNLTKKDKINIRKLSDDKQNKGYFLI